MHRIQLHGVLSLHHAHRHATNEAAGFPCSWHFMPSGPNGLPTDSFAIHNDDHLIVYADGQSDVPVWRGCVDFDTQSNRIPHCPHGSRPGSSQHVGGLWVNGLQRGMNPEEWMNLFARGRRALLTLSAQEVRTEITGHIVPVRYHGEQVPLWSLTSDCHQSTLLRNGDHLTVFDKGRVLFDGAVDFDFIPAHVQRDHLLAHRPKGAVETASYPTNIPADMWKALIDRPAQVTLRRTRWRRPVAATAQAVCA